MTLPVCNEDVSDTCTGVLQHHTFKDVVQVSRVKEFYLRQTVLITLRLCVLSFVMTLVSFQASNQFLDHINKNDVVITDRLHVGIAASLLGKSVKLLAGSYYKVCVDYS